MSSKNNNGLHNVRILSCAAMLTALSVVIGIFCKNYLNLGNGLFRITFENFPIILSGIAFGPAVGACVGAVSDTISFFLSTQTLAISPLVTLGAALVGLVSGIVSHYVVRRAGNFRIIVSTLGAHVIGSMIVKSIGLFEYYQWLVLWRIPTYIVISTLEAMLICLLFKNRSFAKLFNSQRYYK